MPRVPFGRAVRPNSVMTTTRGVLPGGAHVVAERDQSFRELTEQTIERAAGHALVGVRVPAAELHGRDVRSALLPEDLRRGLHQRRDAAASRVAARHRLFADELLLLQRRLEAVVQRGVGAIQHRQPLEERIVHRRRAAWATTIRTW